MNRPWAHKVTGPIRIEPEFQALQAWLTPPGERGNVVDVIRHLVKAGRAHPTPKRDRDVKRSPIAQRGGVSFCGAGICS